MERDYYFVLEGEKVIGFNLTEKEKNKLFYHFNKGRTYGMIQIKCKTEQEFKNYIEMRNAYYNTSSNQWKEIAIEEYKYLINILETLKTLNGEGALSKEVMETSELIVKLEREHGLHYTTKKEHSQEL